MTEENEQETTTQKAPIPLHQWTHDGNRVLLVKCVDRGGKSHDGFQWPREGKTICPKAKSDRARAALVTGSDTDDCASGGLFGWPWGVNLGIGKEPDYCGDWIVFAAHPSDVVNLDGKAKAVGEVEVVYYGDALGALMKTLEGRIKWIEQNSQGSASATGDSGSASATGGSGSASATGDSGSASATGWRGIAALSGEYGSLEAGPESLGAVTAQNWTWKVRSGAVVCCRWMTDDKKWHQRMLVADELGFVEGDVVAVSRGEVRKV